jgi:hypothetical protein
MHTGLEAIKEKDAIKATQNKDSEEDKTNTQLGRADEVIGYRVEGKDSKYGKVADFILDDEKWILPFLVIDIGEISEVKRELIVPSFRIKGICFDRKKVFIDLPPRLSGLVHHSISPYP